MGWGETPCIEWPKSKLPSGYGKKSVGTHTGGWILAHRAAWEAGHGKIPNGLYVCHHCDNPSCVNVEHLFLGTPKDNVQDALRKNRLHRSVCKYGHKLDSDNILIHNLNNGTQRRLCKICSRKRLAKWRQENREHYNAKQREWYAANATERRAYDRKWRRTNLVDAAGRWHKSKLAKKLEKGSNG